ncbi:hypothetical protein CKO28_06010 [Rhodovibrio sodomensis]|uniref:Uncharacterized protein n=1 Tax=Rhodovibrio sodomensis TaxID=1088 RepID=A0ABS1DCC4_9PROT|nr:SANT/Myb-like DNA-binding domain-containing protein [Rhodovibrio sodomensis]MBK1667586.1 hypothetical protein [Rhodovibrio sodomensis]
MKTDWTREELSQLRTLYPTETPLGEIAHRLGRSRSSITDKAYRLGLRRGPRPWTTTELRLLERLARSGLTYTAIAAHFRGRSSIAVRDRIKKLGPAVSRAPRPWTEADLTRLRQDFARAVPVTEIARTLARSKPAVASKARALGLHQPTAPRPFTDAERDFLRKTYGRTHTPEQIAQQLSRSVSSIYSEAHRLQLSRHQGSAGCPYRQTKGGAAETTTRAMPRKPRRGQPRRAKRTEPPRSPGADRAIEAFIARNGVTRPEEAPAEAAATYLRRRDYCVVPSGQEWIVDGRRRLTGSELIELAIRRGHTPEPGGTSDSSRARSGETARLNHSFTSSG